MGIVRGLIVFVKGMQHFTFGRRNGFRVSEIVLGTAQFGSRWGYGADAEAIPLIFKAFADAGGTFIDTGPSYQGGESEENVGRLIAGRRDEFSIATKFSIAGPQRSGPLQTGSGRRSMMRSIEGSLHRLGTDYVDMLLGALARHGDPDRRNSSRHR